jgi:CelD/BcsL family acetyltransferase involved in cellulose biosynthesis
MPISPPRMSMHSEIIAGVEGLSALAPDWWDLFRRAAAPTPFQSPAWLLPWCRTLGSGEPQAILLRRDDKVMGLALFSGAEEEGERILRPLGAGVTDLCDPLVAAGSESEASAALLEALLAWTGWDRCLWTELPGASALLATARARGQSADSSQAAPVLRLPRDGGLEDAIPRQMLRTLATCRKRAEALGGVRVEIPEPDAFLAELFRLHRLRWRQTGQDGVLAHPQVQAFHRQALPELAKHGLARFHLLRIGGRIAAAHYGLAAGSAHYYYIGGFDPEFKAAGPGHLAVAHAIERALSEGAAQFHFLRGEEPYKRRWGAVPEALHRLVLVRAMHATAPPSLPFIRMPGHEVESA